MKNIKQIAAVLGILALVGLYAATLLTAIFDPTETMSYLAASVAATILIPVLLWFLLMFFRITEKNGFSGGDASFPDSPEGKDHNTENDQ